MKRMLVLLILLLMPCAALAQVEKLPGEATTFTWTFIVADEPKINGFKLYSSPVQSGPFNNLAGSAAAAVRTLTIPASFASGTVRTFYVVRSYFQSVGGTAESSDSNSVEVELRVPSATGLQVK